MMAAGVSHLELFVYLALCAVFVVLSGFFSGSETGLYCVNRLRLQLAAHKKDRSALQLQKLLADQPGLLFTTLLGTNIANYLAPVCLTIVFLGTATAAPDAEREHLAELYTTLILTPIVFIFGELVPKNIFQKHADRFMTWAAWSLATAQQAFRLTGLIWLQKTVSDLALKRLRRQPTSRSVLHSRIEMYQMLREGAAEGALSRAQVVMLERVHTLQSVRIAAVMISRSRAVMLPDNASRASVIDVFRTTPYTRIPIYRGSRRNVIGIVHVLDVLTGPAEGGITDLLRPPVVVRYDTTVTEALSVLQRRRRRMAIVVDAAERCVGIVTVKDLVEEIVGELAAW